MKIKKIYQRLTTALMCITCIVMLAICAVVPITATTEQSDNFYVENYNITDKYYMALGEKINEYSELDSSPEKIVSKSVTAAVNIYRHELLELQEHPDVGNRSLSAEANAAYSKGLAAGRLAWIYNINILELHNEDSLSRVFNKYDTLCTELAAGTDFAVIDARANGMCTELNRTVYKEKIRELKQSDDSTVVSGLIEAALRRTDTIDSYDLEGTAFATLYTSLKKDILLQRSRDRLSSQFKELFEIICPNEKYSDNDTAVLFDYDLKNASDISAMNEAIRSALCEIIQSPTQSGAHCKAFAASLAAQISEEASRASHNNESAELTHLFDGYTLSSQKASVKDEIALLISSGENTELKALEAEFNGNGGIIDQCTDYVALNIELVRASYRKQLLDAKLTSLDRLSVFLGSYDATKFTDKITEIYQSKNSALCNLPAQQNFENSCKSILQAAASDLGTVLNDSKAERFLLDHKAILTKPVEELTVEDEIFLQAAIEGYISLEEAVREILKSQINSTVEKYNIVLQAKIRSLSKEDSLYLDLSQQICNELKSISTESIDVFYNKSKLVFKKAQALSQIIAYYRQILSEDTYKSYNSSEQQELSDVCGNSASRISLIELADEKEFEASLSVAINSSVARINQINQCARVRIAAGSSVNLEIQSMISKARELIKATSDKAEMTDIADNAIFKINRELTKDEITARSDEYQFLINKMKFLSAEEKLTLCAKLTSLKASSRNDAALADRLVTLSFVWDSFVETSEQILEEANTSDVVRARESYTGLLEKECQNFTSDVSAMIYLNASQRDELLSLKNSILAKFKSEIASVSSSNAAEELHSSTLENLFSLQELAEKENLGEYQKLLQEELEAFKKLSDNYSDANYDKLEKLIAERLDIINSAKSIADCKAALEAAKAEINKINTLLDDAKNSAIDALNALLSSCRDNLDCYSKENMLYIEGFYGDAITEIKAFSEISQIPKVNDTLKSALALINGVRKDVLYSSSSAQAIRNPNVQYPANHNFATAGYWGCLSSKNGILSNAVLKIQQPAVSADAKQIQKLIRNAAKSGDIKAYGTISEEKLKLLKKGVVTAELDISLSEISEDVSAYNLQLLLPAHISETDIIGIVFIDENSNVEFYNCTIENSLLSLDFSHFSSYYIVSENTINLMPLIILLALILTLEIVVLVSAIILYLYRKRKEKEDFMLPMLSMLAPNILTPTVLKIEPQNGVGIAVLLSVAVVAMGCAIAFFAKAELKEYKERRTIGRRLSATKNNYEKEDTAALPQKQAVAVLAGVSEMSYERMLTEGDEPEMEIAEECTDFQEDENSYQDDKWRHRTEINIDSIADQFEAGDLVTLDMLKKKRLVSKRTDYIKILARGSLTKPLIIEAHDFSKAAEDMLRAVGGEAIRIK